MGVCFEGSLQVRRKLLWVVVRETVLEFAEELVAGMLLDDDPFALYGRHNWTISQRSMLPPTSTTNTGTPMC